MAVTGQGEQSSYDGRAVAAADGGPGEQDKKTSHRFGPRVDRLGNEIWIGDVENGAEGQNGICAEAGAKNKQPEEQERIQNETDHRKLLEVAIRIELRYIPPELAHVEKSTQLGTVTRCTQDHLERHRDQRHQDGSIADLVARHDRPHL